MLCFQTREGCVWSGGNTERSTQQCRPQTEGAGDRAQERTEGEGQYDGRTGRRET